ncbi:uncharacterized protein LOC133905492 [Phragmites australis]|uniref:uncharacterized protein LOC133905492 n=1 Tax=Phragmites australis TaxID=29695 RepID=UPI002D7A31B9|nr:uncharacterized protein LOC133905492 [Phragmites australis]
MDLNTAAMVPVPLAPGAGDNRGSCHAGSSNASVFREALTWQVYGQTLVLSMVITSYDNNCTTLLHYMVALRRYPNLKLIWRLAHMKKPMLTSSEVNPGMKSSL